MVRDLASLPPLPPEPAAEAPATVPPQEAPDPTLAALAERIRELQALAASPSPPLRTPSAPAPPPPAPTPSAPVPPARTPPTSAPSATARQRQHRPSQRRRRRARASSAPAPPVPAPPSPPPTETTPALADLDEYTYPSRTADPPAAEVATRPRTEISQLRANYGIARQDDTVSDSRAAAAEPTSVSSYVPRDEPAPDHRWPAVRGSAGDLDRGQGYPPSRDYRAMDYRTTDYRATDYRAPTTGRSTTAEGRLTTPACRRTVRPAAPWPSSGSGWAACPPDIRRPRGTTRGCPGRPAAAQAAGTAAG